MLKRATLLLGAAVIVTASAAACGGSSSAKTASSSTPSGGSTGAATRADNGTPGARGFGNRTPRPEIQTAIAEGTPASAFRGQGGSGFQTAIAEGTPASALGGPGGPGGFGGGRRTVAQLATLLAVDQTQLQTELQASGATIASVAAAHGMDRATIRQALIDAQQQRATDAVNSGTITQAMADDQLSQFEARVDQVLDGNGSGPPGAPPPAP
jgi:hypothetical protein